jgi:hypothetical protein
LVGGSPIVFDGSGKCLVVSTGGLRTMEKVMNSTGKFGASCEEVPPVATPLITLTSINVFPNPTHTTTTLKCEGQFDVNLSAMVRVISMDGKIMMSKMIPMKELKAGYIIDASFICSWNLCRYSEFHESAGIKKIDQIIIELIIEQGNSSRV